MMLPLLGPRHGQRNAPSCSCINHGHTNSRQSRPSCRLKNGRRSAYTYVLPARDNDRCEKKSTIVATSKTRSNARWAEKLQFLLA